MTGFSTRFLPRKRVSDTPVTSMSVETDRRTKKVRGLEAESRVCEFLGVYGEAVRGSGAYGCPDVVLSTSKQRYAVEVKSIVPVIKRKSKTRRNRVKIRVKSWRALRQYAVSNDMVCLLVVEVKHGGSIGSLYHFIKGEAVDSLIHPRSKWVSMNMYDLRVLSMAILTWKTPNADKVPL